MPNSNDIKWDLRTSLVKRVTESGNSQFRRIKICFSIIWWQFWMSTPCLDNHLQLSTNISWYTWAIPPFWLVKSKLLVVKPTVLGSQINFFGGSITLKPLVLARSNYLINAVWWFTMVTVTQSLEKGPKDQWYIIWLVLSSCPITNI